jgi:NB-ARC domain/TIR domain
MLPSAPRVQASVTDARCSIPQLRERLIVEGLDPPWHDQTHMSAGQWWSQIETALTSPRCEHVVLVLSAAALAEDRHHIVKREWRLARREGKTVIPVEAPGGISGDGRRLMAKWMQAVHGFSFEGPDGDRAWANLVDALRKPGQQPRRPDPLKKLPEAEGYVRRTSKVAAIKAALLDERREAKAATVVLSGAGGFGKSTLAIDIMNDPEIQDACFDGILWVELHEDLVRIAKGPRGAEALRDAIKAKMESLIRDLTGASEVLDDLDRAKERLGQLLANKRVLLVIDDAWDKNHAKHFLEAAPEAARLVTTRRTDIMVMDEAKRDAQVAAFCRGAAAESVAVSSNRQASRVSTPPG